MKPSREIGVCASVRCLTLLSAILPPSFVSTLPALSPRRPRAYKVSLKQRTDQIRDGTEI